MITFDAMSREVCTAKREVTTTPLQSLVLLNDPQFVEAARRLAEQRAAAVSRPTPAARNRVAFRALIGRAPDDDRGRRFSAGSSTNSGRCSSRIRTMRRRLIAVGESRPEPRSRPIELAAMTMVVSAIMNFDEFVVVR